MIKKLCLLATLVLGIADTTSSIAQTKSATKTHKPTAPGKLVFTKDPTTGVEYHFYKHDKKGTLPSSGTYASVSLMYETESDSIIFDSHKKGGDSLGHIRILLNKAFNGCLEQGVMMMAIGDSAAFKINTDSLFIKSFHMRGGVPPQMKSYHNLVFKVKLFKIETEQEIKDEMQKAQDAVKVKERTSIAQYLKDNNYTAAPSADSLFILKQEGTSTTLVQPGDSVFITYVGKLFNGTVFDQSANHPGPPFVTVNGQPTLAMVYSPNMPLIHAWVEAIGKMHAGDKVTILAPSSIAYGSHGAGPQIGPYTPLVFDMELLKVVPAKTTDNK